MARRKREINKVLIANRGEIAIRVLRTLHEMGKQVAVVYSEADRDSLPVRLADEAICIGPAPAAESYLNLAKVIGAAKKLKVDALHPGYGFLSENPALVEACDRARIVYIGPSAASMKTMSDKILAKQVVRNAGVPVCPGSEGEVKDIEAAREFATLIGYPLIIKAAMGGGGRGMRIVRNDLELENSFYTAQMEARTAFGDDTLYLEKYIDEPRHIEFQILGDGMGNAIHLYERECSIQRRHQKLIEEAPSAFLTPKLRQEMAAAAVAVAQAVDYKGAGTVEFLCDQSGNFFFIEMNTRIQVEHPVTEAICNIDLVQKQMEIAETGELNLEQSDIKPNGWAIECRINAEDPARDFLPGPGEVKFVQFPSGQGIRVDTHIYPGYTIPRQYDSMIAKIISYGSSRDAAITKMVRASDELVIEGISTTANFLRRVMCDEDFVNGNISTKYIEQNIERLTQPSITDSDVGAVASALEVYLLTRRTAATTTTDLDLIRERLNPWKIAGRRSSMEGM